MKVSIIAAVAENGVIGQKGKIPWHIQEDLKRFKKITTGHHVLMGRKTFESIGRPLPDRINLVLTRDENYQAPGCYVFHNLDDATNFARENGEDELMVIGGQEVYKQTLHLAEKIYMSRVLREFEGDTFFPAVDENEWLEIARELHRQSETPFETRTLERKD